MRREHEAFGPYEVHRILGTGAMGEVDLAFDTRLRREVAVRVLRAGAPAGFEDGVLREARLAAALRHPNICTVYEAAESDGRPYIAMELIDGRSVAALLEAGRLPEERVIRIYREGIAADPTYGPNYARLADVYIALGRYDEAVAMLDAGSAVEFVRRQSDGYGVAHALAGRRDEAEGVLRELVAQAPFTDQIAYSIAMVETALGRHDQAIVWLNRAYEQRAANLFLVNADLKFDAFDPIPASSACSRAWASRRPDRVPN